MHDEHPAAAARLTTLIEAALTTLPDELVEEFFRIAQVDWRAYQCLTIDQRDAFWTPRRCAAFCTPFRMTRDTMQAAIEAIDDMLRERFAFGLEEDAQIRARVTGNRANGPLGDN